MPKRIKPTKLQEPSLLVVTCPSVNCRNGGHDCVNLLSNGVIHFCHNCLYKKLLNKAKYSVWVAFLQLCLISLSWPIDAS